MYSCNLLGSLHVNKFSYVLCYSTNALYLSQFCSCTFCINLTNTLANPSMRMSCHHVGEVSPVSRSAATRMDRLIVCLLQSDAEGHPVGAHHAGRTANSQFMATPLLPSVPSLLPSASTCSGVYATSIADRRAKKLRRMRQTVSHFYCIPKTQIHM